MFRRKPWESNLILFAALPLLLLSGCDIFNKISPRVKWVYDAGDNDLTPVALADDGTIYFSIANDKLFYALNPDGTIKWTVSTGSSQHSPPSVGDDGTVYFASDDRYLNAITPDGEVKWEARLGGGIYTQMPPSMGSDGAVYFQAADGFLYAFDSSGQKKWTLQGYSRPVIGSDGTLYSTYSVEGSSYLAFIDPDGTVKSSFILDGDDHGGIAIGSDGAIYIGTFKEVSEYEEPDSADLYAVSANGDLEWRYPVCGGFVTEPAIGADGTIYIGAAIADEISWYVDYQTYLYAVSKDGEFLWRLKLDGMYYDFSTLCIGDDGTIYAVIRDYGGGLYAISPEGAILWEIAAKHYDDYFLWGDPSMGSDGTLYLSGNSLQAVETDSKGLAESAWPMSGHDPQHTGRAE